MMNNSSPEKDGPRSLESHPIRHSASDPSNDVLDLFDYAHLGELLGFILRAPRRHLKLSLLMFGIGIAGTVGAIFFLPRVYTTESKILSQPSSVIAQLSNPRRSMGSGEDGAIKSAPEFILRHENLIAIVNQVNLGEKWIRYRPPLLKLKDSLAESLFGPLSDADKERSIISSLEKKLRVETDANTIRISADWQDPQTAYDIVAAAQGNFLKDRRSRELEAITESMRILEEEAKGQNKAVATALGEVQDQAAKAEEACLKELNTLQPSAPGSPSQPRRVYAASPQNADAQPKLAKQLEEKRVQLRELDEPRQRRLATLRVQLEDLRATYAPAHPSILEVEAKIKEASAEPREVTQLKQEINALMGRLESAASSTSRTPRFESPAAAPSSPRLPQPALSPETCERADSDELVASRASLRTAVQKYDDIMGRIDSARIEFITAEAAFKYRFIIVFDPEISRQPKSPKIPLILVAGLLMSLVMAVLAPAVGDLFSRRFIETWQARRKLPIPFLGEVKDP